MIFSAIALTEEGALDAITQREPLLRGFSARLIESGPMPDDLTEFVFDFLIPERKGKYALEHPYEGVPMASSMVSAPILSIAITGYAAQHAPTQAEANKLGRIAMFVRTFDRHGGRGLIEHYRGCMTGGPR